MFSKILVPTDGSEVSVAGALLAVPLAAKLSASITVVFVQDVYPFTGIGQANPRGLNDYMAAAREHGTQAVDRICDAARAAGVSIETEIVEDTHAARGIVNAATSCSADLIVMGSHGRNGLEKLVLGSVAQAVLSHTKLPVLVVRS